MVVLGYFLVGWDTTIPKGKKNHSIFFDNYNQTILDTSHNLMVRKRYWEHKDAKFLNKFFFFLVCLSVNNALKQTRGLTAHKKKDENMH